MRKRKDIAESAEVSLYDVVALGKRRGGRKKEPSELERLVSHVAEGIKSHGDLDEVFRQMKKALVEGVLKAELTSHLGYETGEDKPLAQGNHRNGSSSKTVKIDDGSLDLDIPRDRNGSFNPAFVPKGVRRLPQFDSRLLALYARGMTVREIKGYLEEMYQTEVSPDVISAVTSEVMEEVIA